MKSLIKWAGAKRWLVGHHLLPDPATVQGYVEPFLGSGVIAQLYLGHVPCALTDSNTRLMLMYRGVRDTPELVVSELRALTYAKAEYEHVRRCFNADTTAAVHYRAAWFIYLNRTCFNGLYRENRKGEFNVPFGKYVNPLICDEETIRAWSMALNRDGVHLTAMDYREAVYSASKGWFVFLDPPYVPASKTSNFTQYQAGGFGSADQERLGALLDVLDQHGVKWLLTNAATARGLYNRWNVLDVQVSRSVSAKTSGRGKVGEIIVTNYVVPS